MTALPPEAPLPPAAPTPPQAQFAPAPARPVGLAIAALIVGIAAFLSGWVPVWGLIAGGAAVALGAIALAKKQSAGLAVTGLVLGGIAFLVSLVTTIILVIGIGATSTNVSSPDDPEGSAEVAEEEEPEAVEPATGTRENPAALGSTITGPDWTVTVNSFTADANAIIADENPFNQAPDPGTHYVLVNYTATYTGDESAYAIEASLDLVTNTGEVITSAFAVTPEPFGLDELYTGGSVTGSNAYLVPDGSTVTLRVTPGFFADEVFVVGG